MHRLFKDLGADILIGSGAVGTCLSRNIGDARAVEILNISDPESVQNLYRCYLDAGSQVLITNTFAANSVALEDGVSVADAKLLNEAGVALARECAGPDVMVWGSVGPLSLGLRLADFSDEMLRDVFRVQCEGLCASDAIILETFVDPREAAAALDSAKGCALPVVFQIGNVGGGRNKKARIDSLIDKAVASGVTAVGANCLNPGDMVAVVRHIIAGTTLPVTASSNAGNPRVERFSVRYDFAPGDMAELGEQLAEAGVALVGGCCGTTPEHIKALSSLIGGRPVRRPPAHSASAVIGGSRDTGIQFEEGGLVSGRISDNPVRDLMSCPKPIISVEIRAGRQSSVDEIIDGARLVAEAGVDMFDVPDNPGATVGRDAMVVAARIQDELGLPAICHKTVVHSNILQNHSSLIGCWDIGLRGVLVITGDPPSIGHLGGLARIVPDMKSSVEMLRLIREMKSGFMINKEEIGDSPDLCAGCAVAHDGVQQINWLRKKVEAGAEFVFSQPLFDIDSFIKLSTAVSVFPVRFFAGVMPLTSRRNAEFLAAGKIPGIVVPKKNLKQFERFYSLESQRRYGLEAAAELSCAIAGRGHGLYLIMPFGKNCYTETAEIIRIVRKVTAPISCNRQKKGNHSAN